MALIVREPRPEIGAFSLGGALKSVGGALKTAGEGAVKGAGASLADNLKNWLTPGSPTGGAHPKGASLMSSGYLPYVAGGAALLVVGFLAMRPKAQTNPRRRRRC